MQKSSVLQKNVNFVGITQDIIFNNKFSNFSNVTIFSNKAPSVLSTTFIAKGFIYPCVKNAEFDFSGDIIKDEKGNIYFQIYNAKLLSLIDKDKKHSKIKNFFTSPPFSFPRRDATKIYKFFGEDAISVILNSPSKLYEVDDIDLSIVTASVDYLKNNTARLNLSNFLSSFALPTHYVTNLVNLYGAKALDILKTSPYKASFDGIIPMQVARFLAKQQGIPETSDDSIASIVLSTLKSFELLGNVCMPIDKLIDTISLNTHLSLQEIKNGIRYCYLNRYINYKKISNKYYIYSFILFKSETMIAEEIFRLSGTSKISTSSINKQLEKIEKDEGLVFSPEQRQAIIQVFKNNVSVITGPPGTGKTTCLSAIVKIFKKLTGTSSILLCAPTGKAATRMSESTGVEAFTVHHALNMTPISDDLEIFESNSSLKNDLIILDEASMLDTEISAIFFRAIKTGSKVVLLGDPNQLPSVGPGDVLAQIIESGRIPVTNLNLVYRQSEISSIAKNAEKMRNLKNDLIFDEEFSFIEAANEQDAEDKLLKTFFSVSSTRGCPSVSLLTPYRKKTLIGCDNLNNQIEPIINKNKKYITFLNKVFKEGDRVIRTQNDIKKGICNGSIGVISEINDTSFKVDFGDNIFVPFKFQDLEFFDLAYANTIHKSQGSEYDTVIVSIMPEHKNMLSNNIIYTAITRAKKKVIIIGDKKTFLDSILIKDAIKRYTFLSYKINEIFQTYNKDTFK